jgi:putative ABC transport system substrate-binding protein
MWEIDMKRRAFVVLFTAAASLAAVAAPAPKPSVPVVGFLHGGFAATSPRVLAAFREGVAAGGLIEGQTVTIEFRWAEGQYARLPALADELVKLPVKVLAGVGGTQSALAAKAATSTIPIVFALGEDPVQVGLVPSINRPGGNLTGIVWFTSLLAPKRLELLHEMVPSAKSMAILVNPLGSEGATQVRDVQEAAQRLGVDIAALHASTDEAIDQAFANLSKQKPPLVLGADPFFDTRRPRVIALAAQAGVPAIYHLRDYPLAGGLMSYGTSITEAYRQIGVYAARIVKGEKPGDLPIVRSTKFELVINLKTARTLGLDPPPMLLARTDDVIE